VQGPAETGGEAEADAGIADIRRALTVLSQIGAEGMRIRGMRSREPDLPAYSTVAMIAGMAALRSAYFGAEQPSREALSRNSFRHCCTASCTGTTLS
jgi:hypothetical protein